MPNSEKLLGSLNCIAHKTEKYRFVVDTSIFFSDFHHPVPVLPNFIANKESIYTYLGERSMLWTVILQSNQLRPNTLPPIQHANNEFDYICAHTTPSYVNFCHEGDAMIRF